MGKGNHAWSWLTMGLTTALVLSLIGADPVPAAELNPREPPARAVDTESKRSQPTPAKRPAQQSVTKELERDVLRMVENYLPDIKVLLDQLREKEPGQYDAAIRNLAKSSRRLQAAKKRSEEAFELEVQVLQAQSAINLLIAKLKVRNNKDDREALFKATKKLELAEIARADHELAQLRSRLERMKEQVSIAEKRLLDQKSNLDETIETGFQSYLRKSGRN